MSISLSLDRYTETLAVDTAGTSVAEDRRSQFRSGMAFGLAYRLPAAWSLPPRLHRGLRARSDIGVALVPARGRWPVNVAQQLAWTHELSRSWHLSIGLSVGAWVDFARLGLSHLAVTAPLAVRWRALELFYAPGIGMPLGSETDDAFGAVMRHRAGTGFMPIAMGMRAHVFDW